MAELKITLGRISGLGGTNVPLEAGNGARTEVLAIPGGTEGQEISDLVADGGESVLTVHADQDCWISVGNPPNAEDNTNRRFIPSGAQRQFAIARGEKVGVVSL